MQATEPRQAEPKQTVVEHVYAPRGAALELFHCHDREVLLEGSAGTGKSRAALEKAHLLCTRYPNLRVLFVRKERSTVSESVLNTFEAIVLPPNDPARFVRGYDGRITQPKRHHRTYYDYPNGSRIVVGGINKRDAIMSTEFDLIVAFEAHEIAEEDWEKLITRLRNRKMPYQQAIADTNPSHPYHWLNLRANQGKMARLKSMHVDNPMLYRADGTQTEAGREYMATLDQLTGVRRLRLLLGQWAAAEGMVYAESYGDHNLAYIPTSRIPADWPRYRSIDFGYDNPFVCQWWAQDNDGRLYRYRELYQSRLLISDAIKEIQRLSEGEKYARPAICDHDLGERAMLEAAGIETEAAYKDVTSGINAVSDRMRKQGDGLPRLYLMRNALVQRDPRLVSEGRPTCTEEEIPGYCWAKGREGYAKDEPVQMNNHGCDAMRYAVAAVDDVGRTKVVFAMPNAQRVEARRGGWR